MGSQTGGGDWWGAWWDACGEAGAPCKLCSCLLCFVKFLCIVLLLLIAFSSIASLRSSSASSRSARSLPPAWVASFASGSMLVTMWWDLRARATVRAASRAAEDLRRRTGTPGGRAGARVAAVVTARGGGELAGAGVGLREGEGIGVDGAKVTWCEPRGYMCEPYCTLSAARLTAHAMSHNMSHNQRMRHTAVHITTVNIPHCSKLGRG